MDYIHTSPNSDYRLLPYPPENTVWSFWPNIDSETDELPFASETPTDGTNASSLRRKEKDLLVLAFLMPNQTKSLKVYQLMTELATLFPSTYSHLIPRTFSSLDPEPEAPYNIFDSPEWPPSSIKKKEKTVPPHFISSLDEALQLADVSKERLLTAHLHFRFASPLDFPFFCVHYSLRTFPAILLFKNGALYRHYGDGELSVPAIVSWLSSHTLTPPIALPQAFDRARLPTSLPKELSSPFYVHYLPHTVGLASVLYVLMRCLTYFYFVPFHS